MCNDVWTKNIYQVTCKVEIVKLMISQFVKISFDAHVSLCKSGYLIII